MRCSFAGALHFRLLDDERNSRAGAGAVELFDSRAAPPDGAERINRASEMAEEPRTHTVVSMSVIEYTVQVRLPPSPAEPTLVVRHSLRNASIVACTVESKCQGSKARPQLIVACTCLCA